MRESETSRTQPMAEENVYAVVYRVLLGGMVVSTVLFVIGLVRALLHPTYFPLTTRWIRDHYHWRVVVHGLATLDPVVLMMVATVLLILTPVARVVASIYAFYVDHDYKYVAVTSIVLLVMVLTLVLAQLGLK